MMEKTEKASAGTAIPTLAMETGAASRQTTTSISNDTISAAGRQPFHVSDLLLRGQDNALPMRHLRELTGLDSRTIRRMIETERRQGCPVLSDNQHGYWLSNNPAEIKKFSRSMRRRAAEIRLTAMCVERGGD